MAVLEPTMEMLLDWVHPGPAPPEEIEWAETIKPGEYEVYTERLANMCVEANEVLIRCCVSGFIKMRDTIVAIYTPDGDLVSAYCGLYLHASVGQLFVKYLATNWKDDPTVGTREGDIFYGNEALYGGMHNCDQLAAMPIYYKGELLGWALSGAHQTETGCIDPGGQTGRAKTRYDEGMRLTPIKIGENYRLKNDLLMMMSNFVRTPRMQEIDCRARVSAADRLRVRIQELAEEKGIEFLRGLFRKILTDTEKATRGKIKNWHDGTYRAVMFNEVVRPNPAEPGLNRIFLSLHKKGDELTFDFTGTSQHNESAWQLHPHVAACVVNTALFNYHFHDMPVSSGALAPINFVVPEDTIYNPGKVSAINMSPLIGAATLMMVPIVMSKMLFDSEQRYLVGASDALAGCGQGTLFAGVDQYGVPFGDVVIVSINGGGQRARVDMDGMDLGVFIYSGMSGRIADVEDDERRMPLLSLWEHMAKDNCGHGKYRGGVGSDYAFTVAHVPFAVVTSSTSGGQRIPYSIGLMGGYPTPATPCIRIHGANMLEMLEKGEPFPKTRQELAKTRAIKGNYIVGHGQFGSVPLMKGDVFLCGNNGGGGYGDVLERDPAVVAEDLKKDLISDFIAQNLYCVAYDPKTFAVDYNKTEELRKAKREERLRGGKTYDEFEKEWLQLKPPEDALEWYGSWPDAKKVREPMRM